MKKLKICTIVGTRPEIIRLSRVIPKLEKYAEHILIHTGQNYDYELNEIFFKDLELNQPHHFLNAAGQNALETIGNVISKSGELLSTLSPDALLILGDTNSCLAAVAAKRLKIPIFHMEAGNRCFDMRVPEEVNRKIVDHISDINLTYSERARECLIAEGLPTDCIIKTGSPMQEVIKYKMKDIESSKVLETNGLQKHKYFVVSSHREENIDDPIRLKALSSALGAISEKYKLPIVFSTHPRTRNKIESFGVKFDDRIKLIKPLGFSDYLNLQINSKCVLSDSGTITEESSILNFPALNLRENHERHEGMEEGAVMMVGYNTDRIMQGLTILEGEAREGARTSNVVKDYDVNNVSDKILKIIFSYVDYVNHKVWKKT